MSPNETQIIPQSVIAKAAGWQYAYSHDGECYYGNFNTPEEAAREGFGEDPSHDIVHVGVQVEPDPLRHIDADDVLEQIKVQDDFSGEHAEDALYCTKEQKADLTLMLRECFDAWMMKHKIHVGFFNIAHSEEWTRERLKARQPEGVAQ